ncbi:MAG: multicopper oxidase domain-containing protein, partial [Aquamicrobium sp.]|nr:multicopper oxidase domain-containing protein [Aquamicrobium sp.]
MRCRKRRTDGSGRHAAEGRPPGRPHARHENADACGRPLPLLPGVATAQAQARMETMSENEPTFPQTPAADRNGHAKAPRREEDGLPISRRSLLAGSAGLTLGSLALSGGAAAQDHGAMHVAGHASRSAPVGHLSQRAYSVPTPVANDIAHDPSVVPPPIGERGPETVRVDLETVEVEAKLDDRATFRYWTFNGTVPGPFVRVRVGDTVEVHLRNHDDSWMPHNIDF